jgi:3-oxoacyl-[acyl-carrier protein] reductase
VTHTQPTTDWRGATMRKITAKQFDEVVAVHLKGIRDGLISSAMTEAIPQRISDAEVTQGSTVRATGEPSEIPTVAFFLACNLSSYMTGMVLEVTGGRHV